MGTAFAGVINIIVYIVIRLLVLWLDMDASDEHTADRLSMNIFFFLSILLCLSCIPVYRYLTNWLPAHRARLEAALKVREHAGFSAAFFCSRQELSRVWPNISGLFCATVLCYTITLGLFPGLSCSVSLVGSSFTTTWFCSPIIVASFNFADWIGRVMAPAPAARRFFEGKKLFCFGVARILFFPAAIVMIRIGNVCPAIISAMPYLMIVTVILIGLTNGLFSNLAVMRAPSLVCEGDSDPVTQIMVLGMYIGITLGSASGAMLHSIF